MNIDVALSWSTYQLGLAKRVVNNDMFRNYRPDDSKFLIAGFGISYRYAGSGDACVGMVVCNRNGTLLYQDYLETYIDTTGSIAFYGMSEVPHYLTLLRRCPACVYPDLALIEGHGVLHNRQAGPATQFGIESGVPTVGVAKNLVSVDWVDERAVQCQFHQVCCRPGDMIPIFSATRDALGNHTVLGAAVNVANTPLYVSVGHGVSLETATDIIIAVSKDVNPEPLRKAARFAQAQYTPKKISQIKPHRVSCF